MAEQDALAAVIRAGDSHAARRVLLSTADRDVRDQHLDVLAVEAARGDDLALELLVEEVDRHGLARAVVARVLVDESAIDDTSQDVLIDLTRSIGDFRGDSRFTTWLFTIGRRRAVDHLRRLRATTPLDAEDVTPTERISSMIATQASIDLLLSRLPADYEAAVRLRDVDHLPYAEVATRLDANLNTVKARVARGRALLAAHLGETRRLDDATG